MVSRQTDTTKTETRVYKYGLIPLGAFPEEAIQELWRANTLWNSLVALHRENLALLEEKRKEVSVEYRAICGRLDALNGEIDAAYQAMRDARVESGTADKSHPLNRAAWGRITALKKDRGALYDEMKPLRREADKSIDRTALNAGFREKFNEACRVENHGLYTDTARLVRDSFLTARSEFFKNPAERGLNFHRFDGTGYFGYNECMRRRDPEISKEEASQGLRFRELFAGNKTSNPRFQLLHLDESHKKPRLRLRAALAGKGESLVNHDFDIVLHRPIPEGGRIKNAKILRKRTGDKFFYHVAFTVKTPIIDPQNFAGKHVIGIDIGFSKNSDTLKVAAAASTDPAFEPFDVTIPPKTIKAMEHVEDLQATLSNSAAELGRELAPVLKKHGLPEEDHKKYKQLKRAAKSDGKRLLPFEVAYKLSRWLLREPEGLPPEAANLLMDWWGKYSRKYREMHNLRTKCLDNRKHYYRNVAAYLVSFGVPIAIEDINLSVFAGVKEKPNALGKTARSQRFFASPSEFIGAIRNAAAREGIAVGKDVLIKVPPQNTSKMCYDCQAVNKDLTSEREWICPSCGVVHDRDQNAARNIALLGKVNLEKVMQSAAKKGR